MTNIVKTDLNKKKLAAVTLSVVAGLATLATPTLAQAQSYHSDSYSACRTADKDAQVIGGLLGAVVGGVVGSQVSGNGARTEGSVLGAVLGGAAGAGIADDRRNCRTENGIRPSKHSGYSTSGYLPAPTAYHGTSSHRMRNIRAELRDLRRGRHHNGYRYTERRIHELGYELDRLKDQRRRVKKGYKVSRRGY